MASSRSALRRTLRIRRTEPDADTEGALDNVYRVTVVATDAANETTELAVTVTVTDVGPDIMGDAMVSVAENTATTEAVATYMSEPGVMWSLKPGGDSADFAIVDPETGALTFRAAPNYEMPIDADEDNVYHVTVWATDGAETAELAVAVTVTDEGPAISGDAAVDVAGEYDRGCDLHFCGRGHGYVVEGGR